MLVTTADMENSSEVYHNASAAQIDSSVRDNGRHDNAAAIEESQH